MIDNAVKYVNSMVDITGKDGYSFDYSDRKFEFDYGVLVNSGVLDQNFLVYTGDINLMLLTSMLLYLIG